MKNQFFIRTLTFKKRFPYIHVGNTLLVDDTTYKIMFNDMCSVMFLEYFDGHGGDDHYLLRFVIP